jgi:hypothetical protein
MPTYRLIHATPALCYIVLDVQPRPMPWEGVTIIDKGEGQPLQYGGPFDLPAYVQEAVGVHFGKTRAKEAGYPAESDWVVPVPEPVVTEQPAEGSAPA